MNPTKAEPADHETAPSSSRSSKVRGPAGPVFRIAAPRRPRNVSKAHAKWAQGASFSMRFACGDPSQRGPSSPTGDIEWSRRAYWAVAVSASPTSLCAIGCTSGDAIVAVPSCSVQPRDPAQRRRGTGWREPRSTSVVQMSPALQLALGPRVRPTPAVAIPTMGNGTQWRRTSTKVHEREPGSLPGEGPQCHRSRREQAQGSSFGVAGAMPS